MELKDKTAIITGASSGIGTAIAKLLAENGVNVVLAARREDRLKDLKQEIDKLPGKAIIVKTDVTQRDQVEAMAKACIDAFGSIDIMINNAGLMPLSYMKNLHIEEWQRMVDVNITGVLNGIYAVLPQMRKQKGGHIVNVSSVAGRKVFPGGAVYCATKFAVTALSEGLRMELTPSENIRITTIEPGAVKTELTDHITDNEVIEGFAKKIGKITPLEAEDIANSVFYALTQPDHVTVNEIMVMPTEQAM